MWIHASQSGDPEEDRELINTDFIVRIQQLEASRTVYLADGSSPTYSDEQSIRNIDQVMQRLSQEK